ncbi:MAG: diguanylate cyclase [Cyanobacteria bacterium P01_F01_bin.116]
MSLASEPSSQPLITSVFLDGHSSHNALSQALSELRHCESLYQGDVKAAATVITYSIVKNLGATDCQVWLYSDNRSTFQPIAYYGTSASGQSHAAIAVADHADYFTGLLQRDWLVINSEDSMQIKGNDVESLAIPPYLSDTAASINALIEVPIYCQNQTVGVLCCYQQQSPRVWQAAEKSFMVAVACLMALAISHGQLQQQARLLNKQKRQLSLEVIERQQAEKAWQESQRFIQGILDASSNILYVNNFASGTNYYVNGYMEKVLGYSPQEIQQLGAQFLEKITHPEDIKNIHQARRQLAQSNGGDIIENEYRMRHKQGSWHWMLCRETVFQWDQDNIPLQLLGTATDITVHKNHEEALQRKNDELIALARVDALTQVANRRAFDELLDNAWAAHNHTPLTLILCDIDYFKLYNDTYGHQAGDACLRRVAQALKKAVKRQLDLVARYGGEEFAVVLPNTTFTGAEHVAQSIQTHVKELAIEHRLSAVSQYLTLSLGIATVASTVSGSPRELIEAADQGLYQAKSDGRARFAVGYLEEPHEN